ncbi:hypothetical protein D3C80_820070 [compost metagenome]
MVIITAPSGVGAETLPPSTASGTETGRSMVRSAPSRLKIGCGWMRSSIRASPAWPPRPGAPCPFSRIVWPSAAPLGIATSSTRPSENWMRRVVPAMASSRLMSRVARTSWPRPPPKPRPAARPPPKAPKRSSRSMSSNVARPPGPPSPPRPPKPKPPPAGRAPAPPKPRNCSRPSASISPRSYLARFSASPSRSKAAVTRLNRSSAALSPGFLSGCSSLASLRNAFLISSALAPLATPSS